MCRTVVLLWFVFAVCKSQVESDWTQAGPCTCQSHDGVIDLTPLALNNGTPAFNHHTDLLGQNLFSWNPCVPFTQAACKDAAVCKYSGSEAGVVVGTQQSARFVSDVVEGLSLEYSHGEVAVLIRLKCVHETKPDVLWITGQVSGSGPYVMTLFSKHACLKPTSLDEFSEPTPGVQNFTFPTPGAVTMTSKPSNLQTITLLVSVEVLATVLILVVAVIGLVILINRKLRQSRTSPPAYSQLVIDDDDDDALLLKL